MTFRAGFRVLPSLRRVNLLLNQSDVSRVMSMRSQAGPSNASIEGRQ